MVQPVVFQPFLSTQTSCLQHGWLPGVFSELSLQFSSSDTFLCSDHQPPSDHLPCSSGDLDPRDSDHSGLLGPKFLRVKPRSGYYPLPGHSQGLASWRLDLQNQMEFSHFLSCYPVTERPTHKRLINKSECQCVSKIPTIRWAPTECQVLGQAFIIISPQSRAY